MVKTPSNIAVIKIAQIRRRLWNKIRFVCREVTHRATANHVRSRSFRVQPLNTIRVRIWENYSTSRQKAIFTRDCRIRPMTMWQQRLPSWRAVQRQCLPAADRQPISLPSLISAEQGITLYLRPVSMAELTI